MSVLELNLRAKKTIVAESPPTPPKTNNGKIQLEVGKKYVLNCGAIIGPMKLPTLDHHIGKHLCTSEGEWAVVKIPPPLKHYYWDIDGGAFTGSGVTSPKSIRREWTPTWKDEDAWMAGAKFEYQHKDGNWNSLGHSYKVVCDAFGPDSKTTKEWWQKYFVPVFAVYPVRQA